MFARDIKLVFSRVGVKVGLTCVRSESAVVSISFISNLASLWSEFIMRASRIS